MTEQVKILIGGQALRELGSSRHTDDVDYLVFNKNLPLFSTDADGNDLINAAKSNFFGKIFESEQGNKTASPESILELKAYAFVQHFQNFNFQKACDCEYDIKFLVRKFNLAAPVIVKNFLSIGEFSEVLKVIESTKK